MKKKGKTSISRIPLTFWASLAGLGLGTYWVLSHHSLWATLAGMALWANGIVQIVGRMAPVPGFPAFSRNDLRTWRPTREWKGPWPFLITLSILGLLGTAHHALIDRHW